MKLGDYGKSIVLAFCMVWPVGAAEKMQIGMVKAPPTERGNSFYVSNRGPLMPSGLVKLPIGAIKPKGWLRRQLELETEGMVGHLTELSQWCKAQDNAWLSAEGKGHSGWEELPYWLKGFGDLGYVLKDERIIKEARVWIDGILSSQRADGWFGPRSNLTKQGGKPDIWPNMIALNCLQSFYEYSGDERVLPFMTKYFFCLVPGRSGVPATTSKAFTGSITERVTSGCWNWRRRFTSIRITGQRRWQAGTV
jgi:hypothetical protein